MTELRGRPDFSDIARLDQAHTMHPPTAVLPPARLLTCVWSRYSVSRAFRQTPTKAHTNTSFRQIENYAVLYPRRRDMTPKGPDGNRTDDPC